MKKLLLPLLAICGLLILTGCGGGSTPPPPPPPPVVATHFSVTPATTTPTAGTAFNITVTALDASGNQVSTYSGTVHFTSSDPQATLPANAMLTNGTGSFSATLKTANGETITATDTVTSSITGNSPVVNVGPAATTSHFTVNAPPTVSAGIQFAFKVGAYDAFNNLVPTYTGTVHFSTNDPQAALPADTKLASGVGNLSGTLKTIQNTTITATDAVTVSITGSTSPISVVSNAATHLAVAVGSPANTVTRSSFSFGVSALDAANNASLGYSGTVKLTSSDAQAMFAANPVTLVSGTGQFKVAFETAGSQTITATDTVTAYLTNTSGSIAVTTSSGPSITSSAPPNGIFGSIYGPITIEYLKCISSTYGYPTRCSPCTGSAGCSALPPCNGRGSQIPCVATKQLQLGIPLAATGGVQPYKWSATGLPSGLGLSIYNNGGYISGIPTSPGTYTVAITVTDSGTPALTSPPSNYTIAISDPAPPVIVKGAPPNGGVNEPYSFTFTATSPAAPLTWRVSVGTVPAGLTLNPDGLLSGTPTVVATTSITLIATDKFKQDSAPQAFNIQIFAHGFEATGSMATARFQQTATLLNNGKVLVAGGIDSTTGVRLASAELYDPASKTFSATGSMGAGRNDFTATLLPSGKVLVTGGLDSAGSLASAEIYDPIAGTFSATNGPMTTARSDQTATLLKTGKVLIAGGASIGGVGTATAEQFDPTTGTFAQTGSMVLVRTSHTATLLGDGRVLIAGGLIPGGQILSECELYDPVSGSFLQTLGTMATARESHTATLLKDGTVLLAGGVDGTARATASAEVFNLTTQTLTATKGNLEVARVYHTATILGDGTVLVAGGDGAATAEVYDPIAETFSPTGGMTTSRDWHTATLLSDGTVLLTGGLGNLAVALATAELYK